MTSMDAMQRNFDAREPDDNSDIESRVTDLVSCHSHELIEYINDTDETFYAELLPEMMKNYNSLPPYIMQWIDKRAEELAIKELR